MTHKAKGQLTKANQTKTKMENLARELQKVRPYPLYIPSVSRYLLSILFLGQQTPTSTSVTVIFTSRLFTNCLDLGGRKAFGEQR